MNFKVVGPVLQIGLEGGEARQDAQQEYMYDQRQRVQPGAHGEAQNTAGHQARRGRQALDLAPGGVKNGVGADRRDGQQGGR